MRRPLHRLLGGSAVRGGAGGLLLGAALACAGCSSYKPFDSAGFVRGQFAQQAGAQLAAEVEIPFSVNDELRAAFKQGVRPGPNEARRLDQVLEFIFDRMDLKYSLTPTRSAIDTYRDRKGNCLSFVNLFVALARDMGLNPFFVEVSDYQKWDHREGLVVSQGHIVGGMYLAGELKTYDFLPYRPKAYRRFKPIDDLTAVAHFYNNLGAEALLGGNHQEAERQLSIATRIAPHFAKALNNMGVVLARRGERARALALYQQALAENPADTMVMTNIVHVYQQQGRSEEAAQLLARVEESNTSNPYFFVYLGETALAHGDHAKALDYMVRALRLDTEAPAVHLGLMKVYLALGDMERAKHHLRRALKANATDKEALRYAQMLGT